MTRLIRAALFTLLLGSAAAPALAQAPTRYRVSFPEPQHRWMQVEATFADLPAAPLELRMSRSSPGRYSLHDFAKNVYDVHAFGADGRELEAARPDPYGWTVGNHGGKVTVKYKVYGDRVDGTYLAVDPTHAHINMPAAMMWARGLDERAIAVGFEPPAGTRWQIATQLHPGPTPFEFTAPNLQYLMDSPVEFGPIVMREFTVNGSRFRIALHQAANGGVDPDTFAKQVEKIVRDEGAIYGEYPVYEPGYYTFLVDYLPWADGDGMEHRNSTVISLRAAAGREERLLDTVAHEFFHCWNVERIRPKGLEPFDFDRANLSDDLWLAEGFTQYYGPLAQQRAGLDTIDGTAQTLTGLVEGLMRSSGRLVRSAEQMSEMAPFIDGGRTVDRTNWSTTVYSYYPFGGAIALALDLSLRDRSDNRLSLDDYMRAMWRKYGKPGGGREGYVDRPYTTADAEATLAEVSGDAAFAKDFFAKYVGGHEVADYARLLARAGFTVRKRRAGAAWLGDLQLDFRQSAHVASLVSPAWPIYAAGIDQDDELSQVDGQKIATEADLAVVLGRHKPGDSVTIRFVDRTGTAKSASIRLAEDPHVEVVAVEASGGALTPAQQAFRDRWLKSRS